MALAVQGSGAQPADSCVLGKAIHIDPKSGDVDARDMSIEVVKGNKETYLRSWPVTGG